MTLKMILAATAFMVSPVLAMADCAGHVKQVMSCTDGMVYDAESGSCVVTTG